MKSPIALEFAKTFAHNNDWKKYIKSVEGTPSIFFECEDWFILGCAFANTGDLEQAVKAWEKSLLNDPILKKFYGSNQNNYKDIIDLIIVLLGGQKFGGLAFDYAVLYNYAWALFNLKRYQEASWCIDYLLRFIPNDNDALYLRGKLDEIKGLVDSPKLPLEAAIVRFEWNKHKEE